MQRTKDKKRTQQNQKREEKKKKKRKDSLAGYHRRKAIRDKKKVLEALERILSSEQVKAYGKELGVDHQVKKLLAHCFLHLMVWTLIFTGKLSQRILATHYNSVPYCLYSGDARKVTHRGIGERLKQLSSLYFKFVFEQVEQHYRHLLPQKWKGWEISSFDSTLVRIYSNLLGMSNGKPPKSGRRKRQIKLSIGKKGLFPNKVDLYTAPTYSSENQALLKTIQSYSASNKEILVFDRGVSYRLALTEFKNEGKFIVTRASKNIRFKTVRSYCKVKGLKTSTGLVLQHDLIVRLYDKNTLLQEEMRLIIAQSKNQDEPLYFLTNFTDEFSAIDICDIYKKRWEIEVFFRCAKQHLGLSHLISNSENGIKCSVYAILITAILTMAFGQKYQNKSFSQTLQMMKSQLILQTIIQTSIKAQNPEDIFLRMHLPELLEINLE